MSLSLCAIAIAVRLTVSVEGLATQPLRISRLSISDLVFSPVALKGTQFTPSDRDRLEQIRARLVAENERIKRKVSVQGPPPDNPASWRSKRGLVRQFVLPGEILSQYGTTYFRAHPRFDDEPPQLAVSMAWGRCTVDEVTRLVTGRPARSNSNVRYFRTDDLYLNDYQAVHVVYNDRFPNHVAVHFKQIFTKAQLDSARACWGESGRVTLDAIAIYPEGLS